MAKQEAYEPELLRVTDENGVEVTYEVLDVLDWGGDEYAVLFSPADAASGAVIVRILPAEGDEPEGYVGVDEDTMNAVFAEFRRRHRDELNG